MFILLNLTLTNVLLSSDNILTIALFGEELGKQERIPVLLWSMLVSVVLQLGVLYALSFLFRLSFMVSLFGLVICFLAFNLLHKSERPAKRTLNHQSRLSSIGKIVAGNLMMSFENEATLISLSRGDIWMAWYAILLASPFIFFTSDMLVWILRKFDFVIYIGSAILFKVGLDMIFTLSGLRRYIPAGPWILVGLFAIYIIGLYLHRHNILRIRLH